MGTSISKSFNNASKKINQREPKKTAKHNASVCLCPNVKALPAWPFFGWSYLCKRIGSEVKSGGLQKGAGCFCQLSKAGFVPFPAPPLFKLSKGTSLPVVLSELYLTKSLLPDEGRSEANPSKEIFGQERGKARSARFGDSIFWRPQFVLDCSVL